MSDEKKPRKPKEERTELEQKFMDAVHFWRKHPFQEAWVEVLNAAGKFKVEKTGNAEAKL